MTTSVYLTDAELRRTPRQPITVTIQEACALSGLSRTTIYRLIGDGSLCALKVRGRTLIPYNSLQRCLTCR
jgi:excisionase family DNA binding protein